MIAARLIVFLLIMEAPAEETILSTFRVSLPTSVAQFEPLTDLPAVQPDPHNPLPHLFPQRISDGAKSANLNIGSTPQALFYDVATT